MAQADDLLPTFVCLRIGSVLPKLRSERPFFENFAKSFKSARSESTKREISQEISRNNVDSSERVSGVFFQDGGLHG